MGKERGLIDKLLLLLFLGPPTPAQPRAVNQTMDAATFTWEPGSLSCSNTLYNVSTANCGTCSGSISTYNRSVTCGGLNPEQECRLSIRSSLECDVFSDPLTHTFTGTSIILNTWFFGGIIYIRFYIYIWSVLVLLRACDAIVLLWLLLFEFAAVLLCILLLLLHACAHIAIIIRVHKGMWL